MNYLLRNVNLLNILLIGVAVLIAGIPAGPSHKSIRFSPPKAEVETPEENESPAANEKAAAFDYVSIADKNLFHPERKIPVEKTTEETKPLPKPEFVLYGTTILNDRGIAYIEDKKAPQSTPGRGKRVSVLAKGEALSGFVLEDIERESVLMVRGKEKITVLLNELKERTVGQPPAVASFTPPQAVPARRPPLAVGQGTHPVR